MTARKLAPYQVVAFNAAKLSENKMHDDTVARRFGFTGGLVPGVDVFAYLSHAPLAHWGRAYLERGHMTGRFGKPLYEGETATVTALERDGGLDVTIESQGIVCGTAHATLAPAAPAPALADFGQGTPPAHEDRPPADRLARDDPPVAAAESQHPALDQPQVRPRLRRHRLDHPRPTGLALFAPPPRAQLQPGPAQGLPADGPPAIGRLALDALTQLRQHLHSRTTR